MSLADKFSHVAHWVFDLDNTLYPPEVRLFDQIETRMTAWVMDALGVDQAEANRLRVKYWREHGTTLAGLMREHGVDPGPYLTDVHDISFDALRPDPGLRARIDALPGKKIVYTNGSAPYAENVLAGRGLSDLFDGVFGVEHAGFHPKPDAAAFAQVFEKAQIDPPRAAMFEDEMRNLVVPETLGMRTVHVAPDPVDEDHIHYHTDDLSGFLAQVID